MEAVEPIRMDAAEFVTRCLDEGLKDARRIVIYAELPDGTWRCFYKHMNPYHFAFAGAALLKEAHRDLTRVDLGEV